MDKYLKYKLKYKNLKKLLGGADEAPKMTARERLKQMKDREEQRKRDEARREQEKLAKIEEEKKIINYLKKLHSIFADDTIDPKSRKTNLQLFETLNIPSRKGLSDEDKKIMKRTLLEIMDQIKNPLIDPKEDPKEKKNRIKKIQKIEALRKKITKINAILNKLRNIVLKEADNDIIYILPQANLGITSWNEYLNKILEVPYNYKAAAVGQSDESLPFELKERDGRAEVEVVGQSEELLPLESKERDGREVKERDGREVKVQERYESVLLEPDIEIINRDTAVLDEMETHIRSTKKYYIGKNAEGKKVYYALMSPMGLLKWLNLEKINSKLEIKESETGLIMGQDKRFTVMYVNKLRSREIDIEVDILDIINYTLYESGIQDENNGKYRLYIDKRTSKLTKSRARAQNFPRLDNLSKPTDRHRAIVEIGKLIAAKVQMNQPEGYFMCNICSVDQINPVYETLSFHRRGIAGDEAVFIECRKNHSTCIICLKSKEMHRRVGGEGKGIGYYRNGIIEYAEYHPVHYLCNELDEETKLFIKNSRLNGMMPCPNCGNIVQKSMACNHITCRCGHHFCILCGESMANSVGEQAGDHYDRETPCKGKWFMELTEDNLKVHFEALDKYRSDRGILPPHERKTRQPNSGVATRERQMQPNRDAFDRDRQMQPNRDAHDRDRQMQPNRGEHGRRRQMQPNRDAQGRRRQMQPNREGQAREEQAREEQAREGQAREGRAIEEQAREEQAREGRAREGRAIDGRMGPQEARARYARGIALRNAAQRGDLSSEEEEELEELENESDTSDEDRGGRNRFGFFGRWP
jgi:hypothetical protein